MNKITHYFVLFTFVAFMGSSYSAFAQQRGTVTGTILNQETNHPIADANIVLSYTTLGTTSAADGTFILNNVPSGTHELIFSFIGYKKQTKSITINDTETISLEIRLQPQALSLQGIQVTALQPDLKRSQLGEEEVQQANPRDSGELLRDVDGVDAVRRGPVGLDPVIRGLRETEVGTFLDGTRIFPGGPARMDSPLSHLDPSAIKTIDVVKGPYALTWGAGTMSAVRVQTQPLNTLSNPFGGTLSSGYDSNYNAVEEAASLHGSTGKFGYWIHGAWREGNSYESGNGTAIPADFLSREIRAKLGYALTPNSYLDVSFGYQNQENIDYPGRLLDADYFDTYNLSANWKWTPENATVQTVEASLYRNTVDHGMDNDDKPTAQPNPDRMPPFGLDVGVDAHMYATGGKLSTTLTTGNNWDWQIGADFYHTNRKAIRTIDRSDEGMKPPAFPLTDLMWPDANIMDVGLYTQLSHSFTDRLSASGTVRLDVVNADADTSSSFFKENVSTGLSSSEANLSGSFTLSYIPAKNWTLGAGFGSVVRTADATERYSDRTPASKAQTSAEFVGNPSLDPERSTQADMWISAAYPKWNFSLNAFARQMDNYITIRSTDLPKRLPLSPETVFQYTNGSAQFWGLDATTSYRLVEPLKVKAGLSYLWGEDKKLEQPALGVSPFTADAGLRYEATQLPLSIEGTVHFVDQQDRVAILKGETTTDAYITADLQVGATIWKQLSLQAGVKNITDVQYVNHLNAKNPFSGQPIPEPGRVFFADLQFTF
ncbi:TonB-dependent receptor [Fodinibius salsisoli]|uniref:TonB-dependent receptor n=1 Tax=Fodinibius salsisoli TaxID=2820877 RepID=A0ABT3PNE9_9BACT|nr:TonB-dependent receptor [Fodinibius salsisoli]MCW9707094.1 TonB-dependent receptor [Fodinibius salsisoli]